MVKIFEREKKKTEHGSEILIRKQESEFKPTPHSFLTCKMYKLLLDWVCDYQKQWYENAIFWCNFLLLAQAEKG